MNALKELDKLKDIKPTLPNSFLADNLNLIISASAAIGLIALILTIYFFVIKNRRKRKKLTKFQLALQNLKQIDFSKTKDAVYTFSESGYIAAQKLDKLDEFKKILQNLEKYKYKKEVPKLDKEDILKMKNFIKELK